MAGTTESFEQACREVAASIAETVISKQHDYGHDNILAFKEQGLVVRLSDKVARLKNLLWTRTDKPKNESIEDTFVDVAGYAIIGLMLAQGTFTNNLTEKGNDSTTKTTSTDTHPVTSLYFKYLDMQDTSHL